MLVRSRRHQPGKGGGTAVPALLHNAPGGHVMHMEVLDVVLLGLKVPASHGRFVVVVTHCGGWAGEQWCNALRMAAL